MAIWNMLARLTMDSTAFDRNAGKARKSMRELSEESNRTGKRLLDLVGTGAKLAGIGGGLYAAKRVFSDITGKAMAQQEAVRKLAAAYSLTNDATAENVSASEAFAASLQQRTTLADELILSEMAYGKTLGITTDRLGDATVAAIGLTSHGMELHEAMKIMALAFKGETGQLKERGILVDANLTPQEKFNELVRQGAEKFKLAEDATRSAAGAQAQFANTLGDTKELIGQAFLPAMHNAFTGIHDWLESNQADIKAWASDFKEGVEIVTGAMDKLHEKAFSQSDIKTMFESFGPSKQESILKAYESHTGERFGYTTRVVPGGIGGGAAVRVWEGPANEEYARKLIAAYRRDVQKRHAGDTGPAAPGGDGALALDIKGVLGTSGGTSQLGTANANAVKQVIALENELRREMEIIGRLGSSHERAAKMVEYETALRAAYADSVEVQNQKLDEYRRLLDDLERQQKLVTLGDQVGDAWGGALEDMVLGAKKAREAFKDLGLEIARAVLRQTVTEKISSNISNAFVGMFSQRGVQINPNHPEGVNTMHSGGLVGSDSGSMRFVPPSLFASAPRLHDGLSPDEFPAILQRGERVQSVAEVRAGRMAAAPNISIHISNHSTAQVEATTHDVQFDGRRMIVGMVLQDRRNNGPMSRAGRKR